MSAGNEYNAYSYDVIDSYEKERTTEHRGVKLGDAYDTGTPGIFNNNILITRMEFANGLTFKGTFTYEEKGEAKTEDNFLKVLFDGYGDYTENNTKPKAIRVWSGNDHWLLTKESACKYLYVIPVNQTISNASSFNLIYWNGTFSELSTSVSTSTLLQEGHAFLYHAGAGSGGSSGDSSPAFTEPMREDTGSEDDVPLVTMYDPSDKLSDAVTSPVLGEGEGKTTIQFPQVWENISYVYLYTAPYHQKFAPADDHLQIPLYGGVFRFVFKDQSTFDLTTRSSMSYFYTLEELRTYSMPEVENPTTTNPFDWDAAGVGGIRHVPLVVVNPANSEQRKRVLDSFDSNVTSEPRDSYTIEVDSKTMYEPTLQAGFKILSYPKKMDISYMDKTIDLDGMRVAYVQPGVATQYFNASDGTLFLDTPQIYDHELCIGNVGNVIERIVYAQADENSPKLNVMNLKYPVAEPTPEEVIAFTQVALPTYQEEETSEEKEADVGQLVASVHVSLGGSEVDDLPENMLFPLKLGASKKSVLSKIKRFFSGLWKKIKHHGQKVGKEILDKAVDTAKKEFEPQKLLDMGRESLKQAFTEENELGEATRVMLTSTSRVLLTSCLVPPLTDEQKQLIRTTNARLKWGDIMKGFEKIKHFLVKGVAVLKKTFKKVTTVSSTRRSLRGVGDGYKPAIIKETQTWVVNDAVKPLCHDMLLSGIDPESTEDTQTVKVFTGGQQQTVILHHPQAVTDGGLIGLRMRKPPVSDTVAYGEATGDHNLDDAEFVAVDSNNQDVLLTGANTLDGTPYLTVANGGIIGHRVKWSSSMANGQADLMVTTTAEGLGAYLRQGHQLSGHLLQVYERTNSNSVLHGFTTLFNKARKFFKTPTKVAKVIKKKISKLASKWKISASKLLQYPNRPKLGLPGEEETISAYPDAEPVNLFDGSSDLALTSTTEIDSQVDDQISENCEAILFDRNFPTENAITLENLQDYFKETSVAILDQNDEELTGEIGSGLSRNYVAKGQVEVGETLCRDLLEFGTARLSWNGIMFEIGGESSGFMNPVNYPDYQLVLIKAPDRTEYVYGDKSVDLTGASWNLVDTANNNQIIIESLTMKNVLCEPLPNNVEEVQLEVPEDDEQKTKIEVSFLGFKNREVLVTILAPFMKGLEEMSQGTGEVSEEVTNGTLALDSNLTPVRLAMRNTIEGVENANAVLSWPTTTYELLKKLNAKLILQDNFMHQKVFPISEMSETLANKVFTVTYDPTIAEDIQLVKISGMGYCTEQWISKAQVGYAIEDDMVEGEIEEEHVSDQPPEDWDGTTPENGDGQVTTMTPDVESAFMKMVYHRVVSRSPVKHAALQGTTLTSITQFESIADKLRRLFKAGKSGIGSLFKRIFHNEHMLIRSSGLRHHNVSSFFKKLWRGIKKAASKVGHVVVDIGKKVGTLIYDAGKKVVKEHGPELLDAAVKAGISKLAEAAAASTKNGQGTLWIHDGSSQNGVLQFQPVFSEENLLDEQGYPLPVRGIRAHKIKGKNKLAYIYGAHRRFSAGFHHRNPSAVPGTGLISLNRRYPDIFRSKLGNVVKANDEDEEPCLDVVENVPMSTYEEETILADVTYDLSSVTIYPDSLSFSSQDLILGDHWPSLEEFAALGRLYIQQKEDQVWISLPLDHPNIEIKYYSNMDVDSEQIVEVHLTIGSKTYETFCLLSLNDSQLTPISPNTNQYVWFYTLPSESNLDTLLLVYLSERRYNHVAQLSDGTFQDVNGKEGDEQKFVVFENRHVKNIGEVRDYASSVTWKDSEDDSHIMTCVYTRDVSVDGSEVEPYHFNYNAYVPPEEGVMQIKKYGDEENIYVNKDDILFSYDAEENSLTIIGFVPGTTKNTATIGMFSEIVTEFT